MVKQKRLRRRKSHHPDQHQHTVKDARHMRIKHLDEMKVEALREAAEATAKAWADELTNYKAELEPMPRRMNATRIAYLKGVISGLSRATREVEKRAPLKIVGSDSVNGSTT